MGQVILEIFLCFFLLRNLLGIVGLCLVFRVNQISSSRLAGIGFRVRGYCGHLYRAFFGLKEGIVCIQCNHVILSIGEREE